MRKPSVLPVPVCAVASTSRPSSAGGMQPACTGVGVSNLLASSRAIRAGERENCENCVVKIVYFLRVPRAARFPGGLQSEPDMRRAHESCRARTCLSNMRKGEPKVDLRTGHRHSKGERQRPGAATRYFIARRHIADRLPAPTLPRFHLRSMLQSFKEARYCIPDLARSIAESPGGRLMGIRCRGLGEICARQTCLLRASRRSRPNH